MPCAPQLNADASRDKLNILLKIVFGLTVAAIMCWLVWSTVDTQHHWINTLFLSLAILSVAGLFIYRTGLRWSRPMERLINILPLVQAGEVPIEEISKIAEGLAPLVPIVRQLVHELKMQKQFVAELNHEIEQRIAGRTSALERQIGSLKNQAVKDVLTGLFNRRMFDTHLPQIIQQCMTTKTDASLLAIDVDNFKQLNDTLGHGAGDEMLRNIGQIIRSGIREDDSAFRIGGDEFIIVMCGAKPDAARRLASRLTDLVDALAKPLKLSYKPRLSIGAASLSQLPPDSPLRDLVELADKQLYEVKAARRRISPALPPLAKAG